MVKFTPNRGDEGTDWIDFLHLLPLEYCSIICSLLAFLILHIQFQDSPIITITYIKGTKSGIKQTRQFNQLQNTVHFWFIIMDCQFPTSTTFSGYITQISLSDYHFKHQQTTVKEWKNIPSLTSVLALLPQKYDNGAASTKPFL